MTEMTKIPLLLQASREPQVGEKILTSSDTIATVKSVGGGFVVFNSESGSDTQVPSEKLRWFKPLNLWAVFEEKTR